MRPLEDVRIIALEQYGAGPFGSVHLADLGAEVIKIEDPRTGGDIGRYVPPYVHGEDSLFYETFNRNKQSLSLDISTPAGRAVFEDLVRTSDAVWSNLRGDVPAKIGIRYADLAHLNPAIVCCSLTGFGMTGPRRNEPGYDYVLQGIAGWMSLTGDPDGPPTKTGLSLVDFSSGFVAALSLLAGLHVARRDGVGGDCDVSLYDTAVSLLTYPATWAMTAGYEPVRTVDSAHPSLVPFQAFAASDGWLVVGCAKEKFWQRLVAVIGRPDLGDDARFATFALRDRNREALLPQLKEAFLGDTVEHWLAQLQAAGVPSSPINDVGQALADPQAAARGLLLETEHPHWGTVKQVGSPVRFGPQRTDHVRAPHRNEHQDRITRDLLGYSAERVAELEAAGAFGQQGS
ncbi:CaiB/BaiF CoA transferase family protein [Klenkia taihuensis]|uniref:Crotonobetainyl-CoA:carnitine CoA-transferase CaiB n=1 Tax=Klenkia taihuensis TaxID=1225127 RepID=A0A1I1HYG4_9ACTN|nr:CoA transferase [Klenkia taihuensis]GHE08957.1 CoA transferase [Klenkia taihuensis]SFC28612.1 Crotonobetainyl-CoA:carnitine CoA-transferase CaiB [Klenkia taihuensis]